jgi:Acetyltransferase (GNAT) domain
MSERIEWITNATQFEALRGQWDRLAASQRIPFARHGWHEAWWGAFSGGRQLSICAVWRGDELAAVFPLSRGERRGRLESMSNTHSPIFTPFGVDSAAVETAVAAAIEGREVALSGLPEEGQIYRRLVEREPLALPGTRRTSPLVPTDGDPCAYRALMRPRWREIERRRRKLLREHAVEVYPIVDPADVPGGLDRGLDLEARGWKGRQGTAILCSSATEGFYRRIAENFAELGDLRLSALIVDGRLAAFDLAILHDRRYWLLKTTFEEDLRSLSPGLALRLWVIERCFEVGLEAHEFLGGNQAWKLLFATGERHERALHLYPTRPVPALRYGYRAYVRPRLKAIYHRAKALSGRHRALP